MARLGTIGTRRVILCETDVGTLQPLTDASGTPVGYEMSSLFDPIIGQSQKRLEDKARAICAAVTKTEEASRNPLYPKLADYREVK